MQPPSGDFDTAFVPGNRPGVLMMAVGIALLAINFGVAAMMLAVMTLE